MSPSHAPQRHGCEAPYLPSWLEQSPSYDDCRQHKHTLVLSGTIPVIFHSIFSLCTCGLNVLRTARCACSQFVPIMRLWSPWALELLRQGSISIRLRYHWFDPCLIAWGVTWQGLNPCLHTMSVSDDDVTVTVDCDTVTYNLRCQHCLSLHLSSHTS